MQLEKVLFSPIQYLVTTAEVLEKIILLGWKDKSSEDRILCG